MADGGQGGRSSDLQAHDPQYTAGDAVYWVTYNLVIHDDMDLDPGTIRVKVGGGHGGHNGLKSIHAKLQDDGYVRVRVGTGHPPGRKPVVDYELQTPKGDDAEAFEHAVALAADAVSCIIDHGAAKAMNTYN